MSNNIFNEIDNIIQFAAEYPRLDGEIQQQEESASEPTFQKIDNDILVLKW